MAPIFKPLALASALFAAISSAAPVSLNKREEVVVWETVTTVVWTTIDVTVTIYPTQHTPTPIVPTTTAEPTPTTAPAPKQPKPTGNSAQPGTQPAKPAPTVAPIPVAAPVVQPAPVAQPAPVQSAPVAQPAPEELAPLPATTAAPSTSTTTQAPQPTVPAATSGGSSSTGTTPNSGYSGSCSKESPCVGQVTYYDTATSASAPSSCGDTNDGFTENVLALPVGIMTNADCGKTVTVTYNGVTKTGTVVDKCMGCDNTSIDLSRHFFGELADMTAGRLHGVTWYIN